MQGNELTAQYTMDAERCMHVLQKNLIGCNTPQEVAMATMMAATEYYDAEWCGVLDVDMDLGVWSSYWWYSKEHGAMAKTKCKDLEMLDNYESWFLSMREHSPLIITDIQEVKESNPEEYATLERLGVESMIAVPFWMRYKGFLVVKNPKRHKEQPGFMRFLNYGIVTSLNEHRLLETNKLSMTSSRIASETDVFITLFGELKITTSKGVLTELELKSPKIARLLVYLLLSRKVAVSPWEIANAIWPEDAASSSGKNMKGLVYRLQQAFSLVSDYRLIESTPNGYQINPKLNIITDVQLFDNKWHLALNALTDDDKSDWLKKLIGLYEGDILLSASSEHWLMAISWDYQHRYMGAVNELLRIMWKRNCHHHIHSYAAKALVIVPYNVDIHYWLIRSMAKQGHIEMARSELRMASGKLLEEEYEAMVSRLIIEKECIDLLL